MNNRLEPQMSEKQRIELLEANAEGIEEMTYLIPLSDEEMNEKRISFVNVSVTESRVSDEYSEVKKQYRDKLKDLVAQKTATMLAIKQGAVEETGKVYKMLDREANSAIFYNSKGYVVLTRPMLPEEKQTTIYSLKKAVNG